MIGSRLVRRGLLTAALAAGVWLPAHAQTDQEQSLRAALALLSGGYTETLGSALQLIRRDDAFHIRIALPEFLAPPDAAIHATATQLPSGVWQIGAITLPPFATLSSRLPPPPGAAPVTFGYSIARQSGQAKIDPTLASPATYEMALDGIVFHSNATRADNRLTVAHIGIDGTVSGDSSGLLDRTSTITAEDLRFAGHDDRGMPVAIAIRSGDGRYTVHGYDSARAARLRQVLAGIAAKPLPSAPPPAPGQPPSLSPLQRRQLSAMIDASAGLLSGLSVDETLRGFHIVLPQGAANVGRIHFALDGAGAHDHVAVHVAFGLDDLALTAAPPQFRPLLPRTIAFRATVSGLKAAAVREFLHAALVDGGDPVLLRAQAITLLNEPGARAEIESLSADFGPMQIRGTARIRPLPDGTAALYLHLTATGTDALLQALEADPATRRAIPMLLMAKGLGRPEGNRTVWDIALAHGEVTVNDIALAPRGAPPMPPAGVIHR